MAGFGHNWVSRKCDRTDHEPVHVDVTHVICFTAYGNPAVDELAAESAISPDSLLHHCRGKFEGTLPGLTRLEGDMRDRFLIASMQAALDSAQQSVDAIRAALKSEQESIASGASILPEAIRTVPRWHFSMLNDLNRNDAFAVALERTLRPGAHVLDIGSGTGLLAMMAVRAGAGSVTTCEQNPVLAEMADQIIAKHGLSDVITVVPKRSTELVIGVDMPTKADLIVSEIVDCGLIGEGILPTIAHAREHLLAPGGAMLPDSARLFGTLLDSPAVDRLNRVHSAAGFDVGLFNALATRGHFPVRLNTWPRRLLSNPTELCYFDFAGGPVDDGFLDLGIEVLESGTAHGLAVWFELSLGGGIVLRNSMDNLASHWMQAFVPFPEPVEATSGERLWIDLEWQNGLLSARETNVLTMTEGPQ